jgi:hypothetical protein
LPFAGVLHGFKKFNACMRAHGWALDHVEVDAPVTTRNTDHGPSWLPHGWCVEGIQLLDRRYRLHE